jgi:hypothetical protein
MKKSLALILISISAIRIYAQTPVVVLEEDYSKPRSFMHQGADEFQTNSIENGMYISKANKMHAQLDFEYELYDEQKKCTAASDIEFTIVKVKGDKESFISIYLYLTPHEPAYLVFSYNELGQWQMTNRNEDVVFNTGNAKINAGAVANVIKLQHRRDEIHYWVNGERVLEFKLKNEVILHWNDAQVYAKNKKLVVALDKVVMTGYQKDATFEKSDIKLPEQPVEAVLGVALPDPNEVIDFNKVYEPKPDTDIVLFRDKNDLWGAKNLQGEVLFAPKLPYPEFYDGVAFVYNGYAGLVDRTGKELTPYQFYDFKNFSEGWAAVSICDENGENCRRSYIDKTGKEMLALPSKYVEHGSFYDGLAVVRVLASGTGEAMSDYKYGYIDKTGKEVIPATFEDAGDFHYNRAPVSVNNSIGYINKTGQLVIPAKYYKSGYMRDYVFKEGIVRLFSKEGSFGYNEKYKFGFIDVNGKEFVPLQYSMATDFVDGVAVVMNDKNYGYIGKDGMALTSIKYENFSIHENLFSEGLAMVSIDGKHGYIDKTGKEVIPLMYADAAPFSEGLAGVKVCTGEYPDEVCKWGFIDKTGKMVIAPQFNIIDELFGFSEGLMVVAGNCTGETYAPECKWGFMDKTGKLVIPMKYDYAEVFAGGLAIVQLKGETFMVNNKGVELKGGVNPFGE